jgi:RNA polymerase sigma-70 factor (ECF subfamily)
MESNQDLIIFNKLFSEYQERFIRFAYSYTADRMASEDIVMESMMYYWTNRSKLKDTNPPAYILTSIKNKSLNYLRDQQLHLSVIDKLKDLSEWKLNTSIASLEACEPNDIFSKEVMEKVNEAIERMPATTKKIFVLCRLEEKSHQEIADEMAMTTKGVEYHLAKATEFLRKQLKDYYPFLFLLMQINE